MKVKFNKSRRHWSVEEKMAIVLAALRNEQSVRTLAQRHEIHENQLHRWKSQFLRGGQQALYETKTHTQEQLLRVENERLKRILGEKTLEIDLLKKNYSNQKII